MSLTPDQYEAAAAYRNRCFSLLESFRGHLSETNYDLVHELIDVNEPVIALEVLASIVVEQKLRVPASDIRRMIELGSPHAEFPSHLDKLGVPAMPNDEGDAR